MADFLLESGSFIYCGFQSPPFLKGGKGHFDSWADNHLLCLANTVSLLLCRPVAAGVSAGLPGDRHGGRFFRQKRIMGPPEKIRDRICEMKRLASNLPCPKTHVIGMDGMLIQKWAP
jgi:hypothetical protein